MHKRREKNEEKSVRIHPAVALALNLAACGNDKQASNDGRQDSGAETIKIGWYGPLSGSAASVGTTGNMATKLAIKQINENGGILGKQIELMEYDDQGNTETSVKNVTRLIQQDQVVGIIGSHLSAAVSLLRMLARRQR